MSICRIILTSGPKWSFVYKESAKIADRKNPLLKYVLLYSVQIIQCIRLSFLHVRLRRQLSHEILQCVYGDIGNSATKS